MPVQFVKPESHPATQERIDEVLQWVDGAVRSLAPAVQRAGEEMGRSFRSIAERRP